MRNVRVTSISLPDELCRHLKQAAEAERRSVSEVAREAIRQYLDRQPPKLVLAAPRVKKAGRRVS